MDIFNTCCSINTHLSDGDEKKARNLLIHLLDYLEEKNIPYPPLVNHLIRKTGLYPYIRTETSDWQDRFVYEAFQVDTGDTKYVTLHREQSALLKELLNGKNIAVSAPTSFGKSFVIDAFIALKRPKNVVVIVPTIALTDETRRRLYKKFSLEYKIITTPDIELGARNIMIFPQERALNYLERLEEIDILIVDEFYKAGLAFDKDRAPTLLKAILEFSQKAHQRYFLAPNIEELKDNPFTKDMTFVKLDFNTVVTEISKDYLSFGRDVDCDKEKRLLEILRQKPTKTLIYVGTYSNLNKVCVMLETSLPDSPSILTKAFSDWLKINYGRDYLLSNLVCRGVGVHNGRLHRALSQLQVRMFEEPNGLANLVSTSSIIEGVNTSAENVIVWSNKNGNTRINNFTYKNIVGRSGRMFRHFIGKVYLFEEPPKEKTTELALEFSEDLLMSIDPSMFKPDLTREQIIKIVAFKDEMDELLGGSGSYQTFMKQANLQVCNGKLLREIAQDIKNEPQKWEKLDLLNSPNPRDWNSALLLVWKYLQPKLGGYKQRQFINFLKVIPFNWEKSIPEMMLSLNQYGLTIEDFFRLERAISFNLSMLLGDINKIQKLILRAQIDISPFITKTSHVFLPKLVYELEEYGLPRMLSKKIHDSGILDLELENRSLDEVIQEFNSIGKTKVLNGIDLHPFESFVIDYFYEGISIGQKAIPKS